LLRPLRKFVVGHSWVVVTARSGFAKGRLRELRLEKNSESLNMNLLHGKP
jgi:hypothetical protein